MGKKIPNIILKCNILCELVVELALEPGLACLLKFVSDKLLINLKIVSLSRTVLVRNPNKAHVFMQMWSLK